MEVTEDGQPLIRDDAIGEILMKDLEKEAIIRTLRFFNNNRRKTAKSLGVAKELSTESEVISRPKSSGDEFDLKGLIFIYV